MKLKQFKTKNTLLVLEQQWSAALMCCYCHQFSSEDGSGRSWVFPQDSADRSCPQEEKAFLFTTHMHTQSPVSPPRSNSPFPPRASPLGVLQHRFSLGEHKSLPRFCLHEGLRFLKEGKTKEQNLEDGSTGHSNRFWTWQFTVKRVKSTGPQSCGTTDRNMYMQFITAL